MLNINSEYFKNKRILVTGACGTVGKALCQRLLSSQFQIGDLLGVDNNESDLFFLDQLGNKPDNAAYMLADIRDYASISKMMSGVDIVFHCAALKHVMLGENRPHEIVRTNIEGVENIIAAAIENNVEKVIFTSSDKAVNPTNVMGTSKLMGERLFTAGNIKLGKKSTLPVFASTRFGNVLGSRGSVIPIFKKQIESNGPITLTDKKMSRFIMSIEEAVDLVIACAPLAKGGEVFVTKMPIIKIEDLAIIMREELCGATSKDKNSIPIKEIGSKPGEKLYEELMSKEETARALELKDFFVVLPAFRASYKGVDYTYESLVNENVEKEYVSEDGPYMSAEELRKFLISNDLLT